MARFGERGDLLKCSFCGKAQREVRKLIAGPGVYICDQCIDLCNEIVEEEFGPAPAPRRVVARAPDDPVDPVGEEDDVGDVVILVVDGPNLSQLGTRDPAVYGTATLADVVEVAARAAGAAVVDAFQSESEAQLVARLHRARTDGTAGVVVNPGALTHYSYALRDALELLTVPTVEVHLSQTHAREAFRRHSVVSPVVDVTITGAGAHGYALAVQAVLGLIRDRR